MSARRFGVGARKRGLGNEMAARRRKSAKTQSNGSNDRRTFGGDAAQGQERYQEHAHEARPHIEAVQEARTFRAPGVLGGVHGWKKAMPPHRFVGRSAGWNPLNAPPTFVCG